MHKNTMIVTVDGIEHHIPIENIPRQSFFSKWIESGGTRDTTSIKNAVDVRIV